MVGRRVLGPFPPTEPDLGKKLPVDPDAKGRNRRSGPESIFEEEFTFSHSRKKCERERYFKNND